MKPGDSFAPKLLASQHVKPIAFNELNDTEEFNASDVTAGTVGGRPVLLFVDDDGGYQMLPLETLKQETYE